MLMQHNFKANTCYALEIIASVLNDSGARHNLQFFCNYPINTRVLNGPGSSVVIATDYGLDGPGSNPGEDEIFRPSRPVLGPTQSPVKWVPGLS